MTIPEEPWRNLSPTPLAFGERVLTLCKVFSGTIHTHLGLGIFAIRRIPYYYLDLRNSMDLPWETSLAPKDQPIYYSVTKYKYDTILRQHNDWVMMYFIYIGIDEEEYETFHTFFLNMGL